MRSRSRPQLPRNLSLPVSPFLCCRRLPHPVADVPSSSGEQAPKPTSPRVPAWGRGRIRFLGSAVATTRWTSSSLYARCSPIYIDGLLPLLPHRQPRCKNAYLFSIVRSRILCVTSTICRGFVLDRSASGESYICDICCWSFPYCQN